MSSASAEYDSNVLLKGPFKLLRRVTLALDSLSPTAFKWIHCIAINTQMKPSAAV